MFDKRKEPPQATFKEPTDVAPKASDSFTSRSTAVIGQSIKVKGTIEGDENLIVEGYVEGSVNLPNNDLTIGNSGNVEANLNAKVVRIDGQVTGDINGGEKVIVSKSGVVNGNIVAPRVTLEDGAKFKGSIDMDPSEKAVGKKAAPAPTNSQSSKPASDNASPAKAG